MNFLALSRRLIAACAFLAATTVSAAPILLVDADGVLTGAKNVNVAGTLYDVTFAEGNCLTHFNGCNVTSFAFITEATAILAGQALLDQVFVNGPLGMFDSTPAKTLGCQLIYCQSLIPFQSTSSAILTTGRALNYSAEWELDDFVDEASRGAVYLAEDSHDMLDANFAIFAIALPANEVPEPNAIALIGLALCSLLIAKRRKM